MSPERTPLTPLKKRVLGRLLPFTALMVMGLVATEGFETLGWGPALGYGALAGLGGAAVFALVFWVWETRPRRESDRDEDPRS